MKRAASQFVFCILLALAVSPAASGEYLVKENPQRYRVTIDYGLRVVKNPPPVLVLNLALPTGNDYQDVANLRCSAGQVLNHPETGDPYLHIEYGVGECAVGDMSPVRREFDITLYDIRVDFDKIGTIHPYNRNSDLYRRYTRSSKNVDVNHPGVSRLANAVRIEAANDLDYARRAYELVARTFRYAGEGDIKSLDDVFESGAGNCGSLSAVYVAVLRRRGIPARALLGYYTNGKEHIYAEFYLENYGWIPVDVTHRIDHPDVDYFGRVYGPKAVIILSRDLNLTVKSYNGMNTVKGMQRSRFFWRNRSERNKSKVEQYLNRLTSEKIG